MRVFEAEMEFCARIFIFLQNFFLVDKNCLLFNFENT